MATRVNRPRRIIVHSLVLLLVASGMSVGTLLAPAAQALEAFDGRLQVHGFFESQLRTLNEDYGEDWDVSQWYQVFDVEVELDIIDDTTFGIDMLSAFVRLEVRYDCIYSRGCGTVRSMNAYGDRSKSLPRRLSNATIKTFSGETQVQNEDTDQRLSGGNTDPVPLDDLNGFRVISDTDPQTFYDLDVPPDYQGDEYYAASGKSTAWAPEVAGTCLTNHPGYSSCWAGTSPYDAYIDSKFSDFRFTQINTRTGVQLMGPWLPKNEFSSINTLSDIPNPFDTTAQNKVLFLGYRDSKGDPSDYLDSDAKLIRDDPVNVSFKLKFDNRTGNLADMNLPILGQLDFGADPRGDGAYSHTTQLSYLTTGGTGDGGKPYRPIAAIDADKIRTIPVRGMSQAQRDEIAEIDLTGDCTESGTSRLCYFEEIDSTVRWELLFDASFGKSDWKIVDASDFNVRLGDEYRRRQEQLVETCQHGDLNCFSISFANEMEAGGSVWDPGTSNMTLQQLTQELFDQIAAANCAPNDYDCLTPVQNAAAARLQQLNQDFGASLTCPTLQNCRGNVFQFFDPAQFATRFGADYVNSAFRSESQSRGTAYVTPGLRRLIDDGRLSPLDFNFSEQERAFNRGSSQQDEKELKEAYLDAEFLDSRLWLRVGKQSIVWGKTELFRTTDQFNPQDLALASLASLEESRINLWAARGVYSLYEVGPMDDVRLEIAFNWDNHEPADLGACGEPYTVNLVCSLTLGGMLHGMTGIGIAGVKEVPDPWSSLQGWEVGGRAEWRYGRFSFALTDFWGYNDFPTVEFISQYSRNVDPATGRPRRINHGGPCTTQDPITGIRGNNPSLQLSPIDVWRDAIANGDVDADCLRPGPTHREAYTFNNRVVFNNRDYAREVPANRPTSGFKTVWQLPVNNSYRATFEGNALDEHPANINFFSFLCSATVGFSTLDPSACAFTVFGSTKELAIGPVSLLIGALVGGQPNKNHLITTFTGKSDDLVPVSLPLVTLHSDEYTQNIFGNLADTEDWGCEDPTSNNNISGASGVPGAYTLCGGGPGILGNGKLGISLTPEQEALLGCGPFFGTNCDYSGIDLLNGEASAILQSFIGFEGTNTSLDILQQQVMTELTRQGRDPNSLKLDYFRTDGWQGYLERNGVMYIDGDPSKGRISGLQPGTAKFREAGIGGPICTTNDLEGHELGSGMLPGCRGLTGRPIEGPPSWATGIAIDGWRIFSNSAVGPNRVGFNDDAGYYVDPDFFLYHAYDPTGEYPNAVCKPGPNGGSGNCSTALRNAGVVDRPELHNRWDNGYDITKDGNPFPLRLRTRLRANGLGTPNKTSFDDRPPLKLAGAIHYGQQSHMVDGIPTSFNGAPKDWTYDPGGTPGERAALTWVTPTCPECGILYGGYKENNWSEWYPHQGTAPGQFNDQRGGLGEGHPFTGDVWASEMAGFSWNLMTLLVSFDSDTQAILQTITGGPANYLGTPKFHEDPYYFARSWENPVPPNLFVGTGLGNCHDSVSVTGRFINGAWDTNAFRCEAERRRFAVHYLYTGDEWGTHKPSDPDYAWQDSSLGEFVANPDYANETSTVTIDYEYTENRFVGLEILEPETTVGSGEYIEAGAHCSFITPQNCSIVQAFLSIAGNQSRSIRAGGNETYGRRSFLWQSGGQAFLTYDRRNVLGFATDFAEDITKSNWGVEFTWMKDVRMADWDRPDGLSTVQELNLTVSMDRPTFINFLNPNHTFFLNTQWFFQYREGYSSSMPVNGPVNVLALFLVQTGYFQDRLLPSAIFVYDFMSNSGAALPQVTYRFSEAFSVSFGAAVFMGRQQLHDTPFKGIAPASNQAGKYAYQTGVNNGLALVRDRDELYMRLRYTF